MSSEKKIVFKFPECWSDDERMGVMFSPFRLKSVNPENYLAKLKFWKNMIIDYCDQKGCPSFSLNEVRFAFQRKEKLPYCLETVIEDMQTCKEIRLEDEYLNNPQNTWSGWAVNSFIRKPLTWGVDKLRSATLSTSNKDIVYVSLEVLKKQSDTLERCLQKFAGEVISFDTVNSLEGHNLSEKGSAICLTNLFSLKKIYLEYELKDGEKRIHLIKIPQKGTTAEPISDIDRSIFALELTEKDLLRMLDGIETKMTENENLARQSIRDGKKVMAKTYLRKKHYLQKILDKRSAALDNIQIILARVHETKGTSTILDAYKIGSQTLKSLLSDPNVNPNDVDDIVDNIKESLEINDEIQQTLANVQIGNTAEEAELEEELSELINEDKPKTPENKEDDSNKELLDLLENLEIITSPLPSPAKNVQS